MGSNAVDITILGLARDCARTIPNLLGLIDALQASGITTQAIIGENGSRDGTRPLLDAAAARGRLRILDTGFMAEHGRLKRMALGREALAGAARESGIASKVVCVVDLDTPMAVTPDAASLRQAMRRLLADDAIFAAAATSRPSYYDLIAFDDGQASFEHLLDEIHARETNPLRYYSLFRDVIYPAQEALTSERVLYCISAFNGLCLYRSEDYATGSYCTGSRFDLCEHLTFNRSVAAATGKSMIIDPLLRVAMPPEHCRKSFVAFWVQRARKLGQRF
ncbi:glycosyltransferase family 2 protein [Methylobacterium organophilum]|uniref:glycosyltransferase family 2 protein n=1 Tax=Methylobacterium organophilum TaxID=410 RepID=UPI001F12E415|nr:glycosyltransferase family 2 protein [Methylobacterium organophilum]UMY18611.1 glycosyltransferase family 2 protein [Methylobacterium organophilum]